MVGDEFGTFLSVARSNVGRLIGGEAHDSRRFAREPTHVKVVTPHVIRGRERCRAFLVEKTIVELAACFSYQP